MDSILRILAIFYAQNVEFWMSRCQMNGCGRFKIALLPMMMRRRRRVIIIIIMIIITITTITMTNTITTLIIQALRPSSRQTPLGTSKEHIRINAAQSWDMAARPSIRA
jgi:hypothetical protein